MSVLKRMYDVGLTKSELSKLTGLSMPTIYNLIKNKHKPNDKTLLKVAEVLKCKVEEL